MTMPVYDWQEISSLSGDNLRRQVFSIFRDAALAVQSDTADDPHLLEIVPRLAGLVPVRDELRTFREAFSSLARAVGLWNYIDKDHADTADLLIAETVSVEELDGLTLHREQIAALNALLDGRNLILSAPTSFGKSILIDALLASGRYQRVAIVLPTIALLDEFRRRLKKRFGVQFDIIMHPADLARDRPTIFLGTQERMINRTDLGALDLTVVDEFYKLDPTRRDDRNVTLNAAVYKLLNRSRQFFFLGPNIDGVQVSTEGRWRFEFLKTRFSTVAVDTYDLRSEPDKIERLFQESETESNWPALIFVSSPDRANRLAIEASGRVSLSHRGAEFASWLQSNVGERWPVAQAVEKGFGLHHGRIPRAVASQMVRMFNRMDLPVLFCTSTLIEGVNTAAKTVLIFDRTINRSNYDFFTFSNIRGRAGRLGQHHVGRVYLFNEPPEREEVEVSPTLFGDEEDAPDDYVVHLDEAEANAEVSDRIVTLRQNLGLDTEGLRLASSIGLDDAIALKEQVERSMRSSRTLIWTGYPNYETIRGAIELITEVRRPSEFGAFSASQLTYLIWHLRQSASIRQFLLDHDESFTGEERFYDNIFRFLRACEYGLPQMFSVVELFAKQRSSLVDYSLFIGELSRWFCPEILKNLDEEGIPIQISERLYEQNDSRETLLARLSRAIVERPSQFSSFELDWLAAALD